MSCVSEAGLTAPKMKSPPGAKMASPYGGGFLPERENVVAAPPFPRLKLTAPLSSFPSIGPRRHARLARRGLSTVLDLLYCFPFRYEDRRIRLLISDLVEGAEQGFVATVRSIRKKVVPKLRAPIIEATIFDRSGEISVVWFGQEYLLKHLPEGSQAFFFGKVEYSSYSRSLVLRSPVVEVVDPEQGLRRSYHIGRIVPIYREEEGLTSGVFRRIVGDVLRALWGESFDPLPESVRREANLMGWFSSIVEMHFPRETERPMEELLLSGYPPRDRIIFEEFFFLEYLMMLRRQGVQHSGRMWSPAETAESAITAFERRLPFPLTGAQRRACLEISQDFARPHPMNRFLLGDVGSGKTFVAAFAMCQALRGGCQTAFLAPTEILAQQHARTLAGLMKEDPPVLLSHSVKGGERRRLLAGIADGSHRVVVGTHAILEEGVIFSNLGLVVVDEQHKFGVAQRKALWSKGPNPDILVMTATPIPRSLALSYYGDLEISLLDELPPGRQPVTTRVVAKADESFWHKKVAPVLARSEQVFVVLPLIEESEKVDAKNAMDVHAFLSDLFSGVRVGLLTGRMGGEEKEAVMEGFRSGEIAILVSTTVIEVGVDIPRASVMVVENAERFGLAQLHQLRGRIGRGGLPGTFYLIPGQGIGEEGRARLKILEEYADGFHVAEEDLRLRGPGEFLGVKQSGLPMFVVADLVRDVEVLTRSRRLALGYVEESEGRMESAWEQAGLEEFLRLRYREVEVWLSIR